MLDLSRVPFAPYYSKSGIVIYNADCRQVLPFLPRFDLLLTDPPYGIGAGTMTMGKRQSSMPKGKRFTPEDWDASKPDIWPLIGSAEKHCIWGGNYFASVLPETNDWLIWHKQNDGRSFSECEMAWSDFGLNTRHYSWGWLHGGEQKTHPTQKPVDVIKWCLGLVPDAKTILDHFLGSGTTLVAAKLAGCEAVGIEINEAYCAAAVRRLSQNVLSFTESSPCS